MCQLAQCIYLHCNAKQVNSSSKERSSQTDGQTEPNPPHYTHERHWKPLAFFGRVLWMEFSLCSGDNRPGPLRIVGTHGLGWGLQSTDNNRTMKLLLLLILSSPQITASFPSSPSNRANSQLTETNNNNYKYEYGQKDTTRQEPITGRGDTNDILRLSPSIIYNDLHHYAQDYYYLERLSSRFREVEEEEVKDGGKNVLRDVGSDGIVMEKDGAAVGSVEKGAVDDERGEVEEVLLQKSGSQHAINSAPPSKLDEESVSEKVVPISYEEDKPLSTNRIPQQPAQNQFLILDEENTNSSCNNKNDNSLCEEELGNETLLSMDRSDVAIDTKIHESIEEAGVIKTIENKSMDTPIVNNNTNTNTNSTPPPPASPPPLPPTSSSSSSLKNDIPISKNNDILQPPITKTTPIHIDTDLQTTSQPISNSAGVKNTVHSTRPTTNTIPSITTTSTTSATASTTTNPTVPLPSSVSNVDIDTPHVLSQDISLQENASAKIMNRLGRGIINKVRGVIVDGGRGVWRGIYGRIWNKRKNTNTSTNTNSSNNQNNILPKLMKRKRNQSSSTIRFLSKIKSNIQDRIEDIQDYVTEIKSYFIKPRKHKNKNIYSFKGGEYTKEEISILQKQDVMNGVGGGGGRKV